MSASSWRSPRIVVALAALVGCSSNGGPEASVGVASLALASPWTQLINPFPAGAPGNMALLPDGRVLAQKNGLNLWYTLTPNGIGSYVNGTWNKVASSNLGRRANTSFILRNGRYLMCGGEFVTDDYEKQTHRHGTELARCEYFDPATDAWTQVPDMPETIADSPAVELSDGSVLNLSYDNSNTYLLSSQNDSPTWGPAATPYDRSALNNEGDCILLQDGSAFCGIIQFRRYFPSGGANPWRSVASTQSVGGADNLFANPGLNGESPEIGPFLLLPSGQVLVLGANSHNGIYTPSSSGINCTTTMANATPPDPSCGTWAKAGETPSPYNHGDDPATVEPNGKVLAQATASAAGAQFGQVAIFEWNPASEPCPTSNPTCSWTNVPLPIPGLNAANFLNLPNGQILIGGAPNDGINPSPVFVYTPVGVYTQTGTAPASLGPSLNPNANLVPVAGEFTLQGTQLNGAITGGDFGDDGKTLTNYPIVWLTDTNNNVFYARSYGYSQMAPSPGASGSCKFVLPTNIPNGTFQVHASANGASSPTTGPTLTVSGTHVTNVIGGATGISPGTSTLFTVTISAPAPAAGTVVNLSSSAPNAESVPASVTIRSGLQSNTFPVTLNDFGLTTISAETAIPNSAFKPAIRRHGWGIDSLTGPGIIYDDTQAQWTVTLSNPAQGGGVTVKLSSSDPALVSVPATVNVMSGNSATFPVSKGSDPGREGFATITASLINSSISLVVKTGVEQKLGGSNMGFKRCAAENGTCYVGSYDFFRPPLTSTTYKYLAYGANGHFVFGIGRGAWPCTTPLFGGVDPAPTVPKACYVSDYVQFAGEGAVFGISRPMEVAYGANGKFSYKLLTDTTLAYSCNAATLGDPQSGGPNVCYSGPGIYTYAGKEGDSLNLTFPTPVAFGGSGGYMYKVMNGTVNCSNDTFTDPSPGNSKACYVLNVPYRADEGQPYSVARHVFYGSGTNGEFGIGLASSGTCSNSFLGFDPDPTHPKHCWGN